MCMFLRGLHSALLRRTPVASLRGSIFSHSFSSSAGVACQSATPSQDPPTSGVSGVNRDTSERICKYVARCGIVSRRDAERLLEEGRISVDGVVISNPAFRLPIASRKTVVELDGEQVTPMRHTRLFLYSKPAGEVVSTVAMNKNVPSVFDSISGNNSNSNFNLPRLVAIGRLDVNTEGLILLTSSPAAATYFEHPKRGFRRVYLARVFGELLVTQLKKLAQGVVVKGIRYAPMKIVVQKQRKRNSWLQITIKEGKNRTIRNALESVGLPVSRLIRTGFGNYELKDMPAGKLKEVTLTRDVLARIDAAAKEEKNRKK